MKPAPEEVGFFGKVFGILFGVNMLFLTEQWVVYPADIHYLFKMSQPFFWGHGGEDGALMQSCQEVGIHLFLKALR